MSGPAPPFIKSPIRWLARPAAVLYGAAVDLRNRRYDRGHGVGRAGVPVICVGNITVGGVGKSPLVAWLAAELSAMGRRPAIALRGYGAARAEGLSDEAAEHAAALPSVPVLVGADRLAVIRRRLAMRGDFDCVLLDDGFQHRRLHRDLDIVLVDASRPQRLERLLPAGWLREPPAALRRADVVVLTHAGGAHEGAVAAFVKRWSGRPPLARCRHRWSALEIRDRGGASRLERVSWLAGRRVITMLGIGHPQPVRDRLVAAGADLVLDVPLPDHAPITRRHVERAAAAGADALVVTGKDWARSAGVLDSGDWSGPIVIPRLELEWREGRDELLSAVRRAVDRPSPAGP